MDVLGSQRLLAAIIEQAVVDRRAAVSRGLVDGEARPKKDLRSREAELCVSLDYFFNQGGLEFLAEEAGFELPIGKIKEKSREPRGEQGSKCKEG